MAQVAAQTQAAQGDLLVKTPVEMMLDGVVWTPVFNGPATEIQGDGLPHVTHYGVLHIGEFVFKVYQLSDGKRVIAEESMREFLEGLTE